MKQYDAMVTLFTVLFTTLIVSNGILMAQEKPEDVIVDSAMTFDEAVAGTKAPKSTLASLCIVSVRYYGFDGRLHQGQLVVHRAVRDDALELFRLIERLRFPIEKAIPVSRYGWSDEASMADNNSSAFNYRFIEGTRRLSRHAAGKAIDINPRMNPVYYRNGTVQPEGAVYDRQRPGALHGRHTVVKMFRKLGWTWGGRFKSVKDYHHFEKPD